jgi:hypothetical protein
VKSAGGDATRWVGGVVGDAVGGVVGSLLIPIVLSLIVVFWLMKLYFGLLKSYLLVIFKIIISPIQIGIGALPQVKSSFTNWLIEIIAYVSVFPITTIFIVGLNYLCDIIRQGDNIWIPSQVFLYTASKNEDIISAGIALAGLGILAKLPKLIPEVAFKLKDSGFGSAIGEAYGSVGKGPIGRFASQGALEGGAQIARDRYGNSDNPTGKHPRFSKFMAGAVDTLETMGAVKPKQVR